MPDLPCPRDQFVVTTRAPALALIPEIRIVLAAQRLAVSANELQIAPVLLMFGRKVGAGADLMPRGTAGANEGEERTGHPTILTRFCSGRKNGPVDSEPYCVIEVDKRPATFATAHERPWKEAVRAAVQRTGVKPRPDACFRVQIAFRTPVPKTINDRWDLDNLVKPTLDAMEGIFGLREWRGVPQPNDDKVIGLEATKQTVVDGELEGATITVWLV